MITEYCVFYSLQKDYKRDLETEIKGKGMQVTADTLDVRRAKRASEMASQVRKVWVSREGPGGAEIAAFLLKYTNSTIALES